MKKDNSISFSERIEKSGTIFSVVLSILAVFTSFFTLFAKSKYYLIAAIVFAFMGAVVSIIILRRKQRSAIFNPLSEKKIFLSYVREDKEKVFGIYQELKEQGLNPWMDIEDLKPGEFWKDKIIEAIKASEVTLLFFSKNSINKRGFITKEIEYALQDFNGKNKKSPLLIPVKLDDAEIPPSFEMFQYSDLTEKDGLDKLEKTLINRFNSRV